LKIGEGKGIDGAVDCKDARYHVNEPMKIFGNEQEKEKRN